MLRVVAVADLHVGSEVGLSFPDETPLHDPGRPARDGLFHSWQSSVEGKHKRPDVLIVNGDCVEGVNRKGGGLGVWTADPMVQVDQAAELLKMWKAKQTFIVQGSNYHIKEGNVQVEECLAQKVGAEVFPGQSHTKVDRRRRSGKHWYLSLEGVTIHVAHKVGVSRVFHYRTTPLSREMLHSRLNDLLRHQMKEQRVRLVMRAHAHYYLWVEHSGTEGVILPCWKALDDWMLERGALDISPDVGYVSIQISEGRMTHDKTLFPVEAIQPVPFTRVDLRGRGRVGRRAAETPRGAANKR